MATNMFIIDDKRVYPNPETILIEPFKTIWERDTSKEKELALKELAFIEFMSSMKKSNPFRLYEESRKENEIRKELFSDEEWTPDELIYEGIEKIKRFETDGSVTYSYFMAAKKAAEHLKSFFESVDLTERNFKSGNPIYKPKDITNALIDTEKVISNLKNLEKKVQEELIDNSKKRGDKKISFFANPNSLNQ